MENSNNRPPLNRKFFNRISSVKSTKQEDLKKVRDYCQKLYNIDITSENDDYLESIFTMLYVDSNRHGKDGDNAYHVFLSLIKL